MEWWAIISSTVASEFSDITDLEDDDTGQQTAC